MKRGSTLQQVRRDLQESTTSGPDTVTATSAKPRGDGPDSTAPVVGSNAERCVGQLIVPAAGGFTAVNAGGEHLHALEQLLAAERAAGPRRQEEQQLELLGGELDALLAAVPPHVVVVVDEAYVEFVRAEDAVDGIEMYRKHPNVVVLRTFSKAFGLAGLRVGYAIARTGPWAST